MVIFYSILFSLFLPQDITVRVHVEYNGIFWLFPCMTNHVDERICFLNEWSNQTVKPVGSETRFSLKTKISRQEFLMDASYCRISRPQDGQWKAAALGDGNSKLTGHCFWLSLSNSPVQMTSVCNLHGKTIRDDQSQFKLYKIAFLQVFELPA